MFAGLAGGKWSTLERVDTKKIHAQKPWFCLQRNSPLTSGFVSLTNSGTLVGFDECETQQNRKTEKQRCDCSVCRSVGGIQLAAQRCFCRQRSYQRDHARSRPIAEAKPVWARSVLPWVTRWESRVMLLSLFFSSSATLFCLFSFFFLISSSHTHTLVASLGWLVGSFGWLFPSLPPHTRTLSFLVCVCFPAAACTGVLSAHTHRQGWLVGEHTGTQTTHHDDDGMRCHA